MPSHHDASRVAACKWCHRQLLKMDWHSRHQFMKRLKFSKPLHYTTLLSLLSPDEHLEGEATGVSVGRSDVIILKDRPRRKPRQLTLHNFFKSKK
jgi:hypothetical protein